MKAPWSQQEWQRALVYGLGLSGLAAVRLLRSRGVEVVGVDRRAAGELDLGELATDPGVELLLGREPTALPAGLDGVVVSPGVPADRPLLAAARGAGIPVIAEVELGYAFVNGPVIGITGSNGKSTTTALAGALLAASGFAVEVCGNIGRPLSACAEGEAGRMFVTELSSFQLEAIDGFHPRAAALLNVSADHLDRHADLDSYIAAKKRLFDNQSAGDIAVINADDPLVAEVAVRSRRRFFSRLRSVEDGCFLDGDRVVEATPGRPVSELFRPQRSLSSRNPQPGKRHGGGTAGSCLRCRSGSDRPDTGHILPGFLTASSWCVSWVMFSGTTTRRAPTWERPSSHWRDLPTARST